MRRSPAMRPSRKRLLGAYLSALARVESAGYGFEIDLEFWSTRSLIVCEGAFLREYAWVILNSGFRESIIRRLFSRIEAAFFHFESAAMISRKWRKCEANALEVFGSQRKIRAIVDVSRRVARQGLSSIYDPHSVPRLLLPLPFIGDVTKAHLLKNLGCNVAKDDRHLRRLSKSIGFSCGPDLCDEVAQLTGHPVSVVDTVLWRFCVVTPSPLKTFESALYQ